MAQAIASRNELTRKEIAGIIAHPQQVLKNIVDNKTDYTKLNITVYTEQIIIIFDTHKNPVAKYRFR